VLLDGVLRAGLLGRGLLRRTLALLLRLVVGLDDDLLLFLLLGLGPARTSSFPETTHIKEGKPPQRDGTPRAHDDSFSNSLPSSLWPSSYLGWDARLARLGREAMVLLPVRID